MFDLDLSKKKFMLVDTSDRGVVFFSFFPLFFLALITEKFRKVLYLNTIGVNVMTEKDFFIFLDNSHTFKIHKW